MVRYVWGGGENNIIYHNNFINNGDDDGQVFEYGGPQNIWDDDYPSGGNYWSDYNGTDTDGDGIGDTPYPIPIGDNEDRYPLMEPYGGINVPPDAPIITGPINGRIWVEYEYNFSLSDPDGDSMYLRVDWGHGTPGKWGGPYASGTNVSLNYIWTKRGTYMIRAQALDIRGLESDWSDQLVVTMSRDKALNINPLFQRFLQNHPNLFLILRLLLQ